MLQEKLNSETNIHWLTIANGAIIKKVDEGTQGATPRINKLGKTIYEKHYASMVGRIKNITVETNKFDQKEIRVCIVDSKNTAVLTINWDSSYGRSFLKQIFNVDLTKNIIFSPWQKLGEDGKKISRLYLSYGKGQNVEMSYPKGTPEVEWLDVKGKKVADTKSQILFETHIESLLMKFISDNGLEYVKETTDDFFSDEVTKPLTQEEKSELNSLKKSVKKGKKENPMNDIMMSSDDVDSLDDLFED